MSPHHANFTHASPSSTSLSASTPLLSLLEPSLAAPNPFKNPYFAESQVFPQLKAYDVFLLLRGFFSKKFLFPHHKVFLRSNLTYALPGCSVFPLLPALPIQSASSKRKMATSPAVSWSLFLFTFLRLLCRFCELPKSCNPVFV